MQTLPHPKSPRKQKKLNGHQTNIRQTPGTTPPQTKSPRRTPPTIRLNLRIPTHHPRNPLRNPTRKTTPRNRRDTRRILPITRMVKPRTLQTHLPRTPRLQNSPHTRNQTPTRRPLTPRGAQKQNPPPKGRGGSNKKRPQKQRGGVK
jgi:hypothetical protein